MKSPHYSIQNKILERLAKGEFIGSGGRLANIIKEKRNSVGYALRRLEELGDIEIVRNKHIKSIKLRG